MIFQGSTTPTCPTACVPIATDGFVVIQMRTKKISLWSNVRTAKKTIAVSAARVRPCVAAQIAWLLHVETVNRLPFLNVVTNVENFIVKIKKHVVVQSKSKENVTAVLQEKERDNNQQQKIEQEKEKTPETKARSTLQHVCSGTFK